MQYESVHELNAFYLLECDPTVIEYNEQPCVIDFLEEGVWRKHIPDIHVVFKDFMEFWEVKADVSYLTDAILQRTEEMQMLRAHGHGYRVVLGSDLAAEPRLSFAKFLFKWGTEVVSQNEREQLRRFMAAGPIMWKDVLGGCLGNRGRQIVCSGVMKGWLTPDALEPFRETTLFHSGAAL